MSTFNSNSFQRLNQSHIEWIDNKCDGAPTHTGWSELRENILSINRDLTPHNVRELLFGRVTLEGYLFFAILMRVLRIQTEDESVQMKSYADWIIQNVKHYTEKSDLIKSIRDHSWFKKRFNAHRNNPKKRSFNSAFNKSKGLASYHPISHNPISHNPLSISHPLSECVSSEPLQKRMKLSNNDVNHKQWNSGDCAAFLRRFDPKNDAILIQCLRQSIDGTNLDSLNSIDLLGLGIECLSSRHNILKEIKRLMVNTDFPHITSLNIPSKVTTKNSNGSSKPIRYKVHKKKKKKEPKWYEKDTLFLECKGNRRILKIWKKNVNWETVKKGDSLWSDLSVTQMCSLMFTLKGPMELKSIKAEFDKLFDVKYGKEVIPTPERTGKMLGSTNAGYYFMPDDANAILLEKTWNVLIEKSDFLKSLNKASN